MPEPSPRPMRLRGLREPGAGFRLCRPICSAGGLFSLVDSCFVNLDQMSDLVQHAPHLGRVVDLDRVADATQPDRAQRVELPLVGAILGLQLLDLQRSCRGLMPRASALTARSRLDLVPFDLLLGA